MRDRPVLLVSNHVSWLDIPVLSAVAPLSFVAKREVDGWPGIGMLARLQQTVFVDREKRTAVGQTTQAIAQRLARGDAIVLFAEGTSSDGNRVLPFRSSLFGAVFDAARDAASQGADRAKLPAVQTISMVYQTQGGVPLGRADRARIGWYGDMDLPPHAWDLLKSGPIDVAIRISEPRAIDDFAHRKALAQESEAGVRAGVVGLLREGPTRANAQSR